MPECGKSLVIVVRQRSGVHAILYGERGDIARFKQDRLDRLQQMTPYTAYSIIRTDEAMDAAYANGEGLLTVESCWPVVGK